MQWRCLILQTADSDQSNRANSIQANTSCWGRRYCEDGAKVRKAHTRREVARATWSKNIVCLLSWPTSCLCGFVLPVDSKERVLHRAALACMGQVMQQLRNQLGFGKLNEVLILSPLLYLLFLSFFLFPSGFPMDTPLCPKYLRRAPYSHNYPNWSIPLVAPLKVPLNAPW